MKTNYNRTVQACFIGYVVQAIVNNFVPLLFLTFQGSYGISLQKITLLVTFNFGIQLLVDLASIGFVDRIGYRASMILHFSKNVFLIVHYLMVNIKDSLCSSINTKELGCKCMEEQEKNVEKLLRRVYDFVNQGF